MLSLPVNEGAVGVQTGDVGCSVPATDTPRLTAALRLFPRPALCAHAWKVLNALLACHTPRLGAHRYHCADCGKDHLVPHSCGGGLSADGLRWRGVLGGYLFPIRALAKVFRAKYRDGLQRLDEEGKLEFHGQLAGLAEISAFQRLKREVLRKEWVVYAKRPFAGPEQVLRYLSRYTHRVAIGNGRLLKLDTTARTVSFGYKDYAAGSQRKVMSLGLDEFLRRFCLHILSERFVKIRHYGLLANRGRHERIEQARALLAASTPALTPEAAKPSASTAASEANQAAAPKCPHCGSQRVSLVDIYTPRHQVL